MELHLHHFDLPLKHVFTISRGSTSVQQTLVVELREEGHRGYGAATTCTYYGVTLDSLEETIQGVRHILSDAVLSDPTELWGKLAKSLADHPFALCALDQAAHDLWGKKVGKPVYRLWNLDPCDAPLSNFTIGIDTIDVMVQKLREVADWPIYKIKLGTAEDLEIVRELRQHTSATFRVDANCGWNAAQTIEYSRALRDLDVEFIEQPLPAHDWEDCRLVYAESALPIIADESCIREGDVERCQGHFHGVNIKLMKCGGMTPARRMIARARQLGLKTMVGCMTESVVGISAIAQLAPMLDYVDMDGAVLLASDVATGVSVERGMCVFPGVNGNGVELISEGRE